VRVRVLAFARLRELLGGAAHDLNLAQGAVVSDVWDILVHRCAGLAELAESTRFARNGRLVMNREPLHDGDELALLPPVGGG
jgi:molybdopterin converting factor small subunit